MWSNLQSLANCLKARLSYKELLPFMIRSSIPFSPNIDFKALITFDLCMHNAFFDKWKLEMVVIHKQIRFPCYVEKICANYFPWSGRNFVWYHGFLLLFSLIFLACKVSFDDFFICSFIHGQNRYLLALRMLFSMPWREVWILFRISFVMVLGINILPPFGSKVSSTDSPSLNDQYGLSGVELFLALSGH